MILENRVQPVKREKSVQQVLKEQLEKEVNRALLVNKVLVANKD